MVEPTTLGAGAIAAYLAKDGLQKLLGPTADYLGDSLKTFTQKRMETVAKIFSKAEQILGEEVEKDGTVPPKVVKQIIDGGSFASDDIEIDYLGGILASSRSQKDRDNRGARIAKQLDGLSNYQIRAHYLIYSTIRSIFQRPDNIYVDTGRSKLRLYMPIRSFASAMQFDQSEANRISNIMSHIFFGLDKEDLIEGEFRYGPVDGLKHLAPNASQPGIVCQPSSPGFELFLWAFGRGKEDLAFFFDPAFKPAIDGTPNWVTGATAASV